MSGLPSINEVDVESFSRGDMPNDGEKADRVVGQESSRGFGSSDQSHDGRGILNLLVRGEGHQIMGNHVFYALNLLSQTLGLTRIRGGGSWGFRRTDNMVK